MLPYIMILLSIACLIAIFGEGKGEMTIMCIIALVIAEIILMVDSI